MTSRLILTLLAVLTGLSVQGSSVEARAASASTTQVAAVSALATMRSAKANAVLAAPAFRPAYARRDAGVFAYENALSIPVPAVMIRIDRARE